MIRQKLKAVSLVEIHEDLEQMKKDLVFLKTVLAEEYGLSEDAKKRLEEARKTPLSEYTDHEQIKKEFAEW